MMMDVLGVVVVAMVCGDRRNVQHKYQRFEQPRISFVSR